MRIALFVISVVLPGYAGAQLPAAAELVSDPFVETYQPEVSVSGNVIVGVMTASAAAAMLSDEIAVRASGTGGDTVCLRAASRDGIYSSKNVYALPEGDAGLVRLPYRSSLANVVAEYGRDEIALSATAGDCDSGSAEYLMLSAATDDATSEVFVYLNSFGATDVFYRIDTDIHPCEYLSEGRRTTFDFICRLGPVAADTNVPVTIIRERFGREQPSVDLTIVGATQ